MEKDREKDENSTTQENLRTSILADKVENVATDMPKKRPKGRPKKVLSDEEIAFKKQIQEETEKAYKEVIETKVKNNIKRELKNKALEEGVRYKDPEPKAERPKRVLSAKQLENLAKGREIAISRTKNKKELHKKLDEDVAVIKEAKKSIRKTLLVDKIREQVDGLDSDEDEEEIVIQKKPKVKKVLEEEAPKATLLRQGPLGPLVKPLTKENPWKITFY